MIRSKISLVLLLVSVALSIKHGWDTFNYKNNPGSLEMMSELGISKSMVPLFGGISFAVAILLLLPKTFFLGNLLNAILIMLVMALALRAGNYRMALIEIPFLAMPLILIWLKYPFSN